MGLPLIEDSDSDWNGPDSDDGEDRVARVAEISAADKETTSTKVVSPPPPVAPPVHMHHQWNSPYSNYSPPRKLHHFSGLAISHCISDSALVESGRAKVPNPLPSAHALQHSASQEDVR